MEFLDGATLQAPHHRPTRSNSSACSNSAIEIADALDAAHTPRHRPPRHQARQYFRHQARPRQNSRLRPRQNFWRQRRAVSETPSPITTATQRHAGQTSHQPRQHARHRRLHVARASPRQGSRRAHRSLFLRRRALRNGHRHASLSRRHHRRHFRIHPAPRSRLARPPQSRHSRRDSKTSSIARSKKIATSATSTPPTCAPN